MEDATLAGSLSALAVYGVKRYLVAAKTAEARETIAEIAARLIAYSMEARDHRFPRSAPLYPSRSLLESSTRAPAPIGSTRAGPPSSSAERAGSTTRTSTKRRRTASAPPCARAVTSTAICVQSLFELDLTADGGEARTTPTLRETNPTE